MSRRICIDIGGTFTDVVVVDESQGVGVFKTLTTPNDHVQGVVEGIGMAAKAHGLRVEDFLRGCTFLSHGTTVSTNAILEGKTAKVGLVCTEGHRDVLLFREASKAEPFFWDLDYPEPYVPRYLTVPVKERVSSEGQVEIPLDEEQARAAIRYLRELKVEAIAVALLWSFLNPSHELRIAALIREEWPEAVFSLSHLVNPTIREYRRTISTVIDASLSPPIRKYVTSLDNTLRRSGYGGRLYLLTASGGITSPNEMVRRPIYSVDSGPALAPVAGLLYSKLELDDDNVITCDMGGTSFDVTRVTGGVISVTHDSGLGQERISVPRVDCRTIGAGGGSIARVDEGGLIHVGPGSAGGSPGPACYCRGGSRATVTDAALVLGYYDPDFFLGGSMQLHKSLAEEAVTRDVALPLGIDVHEAAFTIWSAACANITESIRCLTVREGVDPRDYVFVAGGGAAGAHIIPIVAALGGNRLIVPKTAGTLSAFGGVAARVVRELGRSFLTSSERFDYHGVNRVLRGLETEARSFLRAVGVPSAQQTLEFLVEARYPHQDRELAVPLATTGFAGPQDVAQCAAGFHSVHDRMLGSRESGQVVEFVAWKVRACGAQPEIRLNEVGVGAAQPGGAALKGRRPAYFRDSGGMIMAPVYCGRHLRAKNRLDGPAIVEEQTTSIVLFEGSTATVSRFGNYLVELSGAGQSGPRAEERGKALSVGAP